MVNEKGFEADTSDEEGEEEEGEENGGEDGEDGEDGAANEEEKGREEDNEEAGGKAEEAKEEEDLGVFFAAFFSVNPSPEPCKIIKFEQVVKKGGNGMTKEW